MKIGYALIAIAAAPLCADWPSYLGPEKNGRITGEIDLSEKPKVLWRAELGRGCASFAVSQGHVLTLGNSGKTETVWCFEEETGEVRWKDTYEEELAPKFYTGGPGATPTIEGDRVYTLSKSGKLTCYGLEGGKVKWTRDLQKEFKGKPPTWGYSTSPLIDGKELIVSPCGKGPGLLALDKMTGEEIWKSEPHARAGYSVPTLATYKGKKTAFVFHGREVVAYDLENKAKKLFSYPWRTSYDVNASNLTFRDNLLYLASGYGMGYAVLDLSGKEPELLHRDRDRRMIFQNVISEGADLIGVFGDKNMKAEAFRMDMKSGKLKWAVEMPGSRASTLMAGDQLIILSETGHLIFGKDTGSEFIETGRHEILPKLCWAPPAYANGRLFVRNNKGKMLCLKIGK